MKIFRWCVTNFKQNNVRSPGQVPPQAKNTTMLGQYDSRKLTPKSQIENIGVHNVTCRLHKRFGENCTYISAFLRNIDASKITGGGGNRRQKHMMSHPNTTRIHHTHKHQFQIHKEITQTHTSAVTNDTLAHVEHKQHTRTCQREPESRPSPIQWPAYTPGSLGWHRECTSLPAPPPPRRHEVSPTGFDHQP